MLEILLALAATCALVGAVGIGYLFGLLAQPLQVQIAGPVRVMNGLHMDVPAGTIIVSPVRRGGR